MDNPATFDDRWTLRHTRVVAHPIEEVWKAVAPDGDFGDWFIGYACAEGREGGECRFTWGGTRDDEAEVGVVTRLQPPALISFRIEYDDTPSGEMSFVLREVEDGTEVAFIQAFDPGGETSWIPAAVATFDGMMDDLGRWLDGTLDQFRSDPAAGGTILEERIAFYANYIPENCPPA